MSTQPSSLDVNESVLEYFDNLYPDKMELSNTPEFQRVKLAGKVELLIEIRKFLKEEYGNNVL